MHNSVNPPQSIANNIKALIPGGSYTLSKVGDLQVVAERSGDGKSLTIFRESKSGFETIRKVAW